MGRSTKNATFFSLSENHAQIEFFTSLYFQKPRMRYSARRCRIWGLQKTIGFLFKKLRLFSFLSFSAVIEPILLIFDVLSRSWCELFMFNGSTQLLFRKYINCVRRRISRRSLRCPYHLLQYWILFIDIVAVFIFSIFKGRVYYIFSISNDFS